MKVFILLALVIISGTAMAEKKDRVTLSTGTYFSEGDYGLGDTTRIFAVPMSLKYSAPRWSLSVSTALLRVEGNEEIQVFDGEGFVDDFGNEILIPRTESVSSVRQGMGDTLLNFSYKPVWKPTFNSRLQIGSKLKLPTSDEDENFGTGEIDVSMYGGVTARFGRYLVNTKAGFQLMGDIDNELEYRDYNNRLFASVGGSYIVSRHWNIGGGYRFKQASREGKEAIHKVNGYVTWRPDKTWNYTLYTSLGMTDATADIAAGLQASYRFYSGL